MIWSLRGVTAYGAGPMSCIEPTILCSERLVFYDVLDIYAAAFAFVLCPHGVRSLSFFNTQQQVIDMLPSATLLIRDPHFNFPVDGNYLARR